MKKDWEYKKFESCLVKVPKQVQIKSKDYQQEGKYPIVSQEAELISGYWDDETIVYNHSEPVVIFGDHTKNIKYIDFDFIVGADGTHILKTKNDLNPKFFYYVLKSIKLRELGYARHYKLLKEKFIPVPPLPEQQRIVSYLDAAFAKIDAMKANAENALKEAKALFQASLKEMMQPKPGWEEKKLKEVVHHECTLSYGIVQPGEHIENGVPVVRPIDFNNNVIVRMEGLKRTKREISDAYKRTILKGGEILLCVRGTTGTMGLASEELKGCNVTRGIVPIFFEDNVNKLFVYYQLLSPKLQKEIQKRTTGAALKQINIKELRSIHLMFPPLSEQQSIVAALDAIKSRVDRLQSNFDTISRECDALKQAILREVFEGE